MKFLLVLLLFVAVNAKTQTKLIFYQDALSVDSIAFNCKDAAGTSFGYLIYANSVTSFGADKTSNAHGMVAHRLNKRLGDGVFIQYNLLAFYSLRRARLYFKNDDIDTENVTIVTKEQDVLTFKSWEVNPRESWSYIELNRMHLNILANKSAVLNVYDEYGDFLKLYIKKSKKVEVDYLIPIEHNHLFKIY